jgi:cobalt-zinc-cadmium efflux system outer membrane protein
MASPIHHESSRLSMLRSCAAAVVIMTWGLTIFAQAPVQSSAKSKGLDLGPASLERVVTLAREHAPQVVVASSELETSRSAMVGARLPPLANPYMEFVAGRGNAGVTRDVEFKSTLALPIEIAGQRGRRVAEAESWVSLHSVDLEQAQAGAASAAVRAWGFAVCESSRVEALTELTRSAQAEFEIVAARRILRDSTEQDEQLAGVELSRHRILLDEAHANLVQALGELERLTGIEWSDVPTASIRPPTERIVMQPGHVDATQLPAVRGLRAEAEFHGRTIERYGRESWSPLNLIFNGGRGDFGETRLGVGVGMNLPIFRRFQGEKARAEGDRNRSLAQAQVTARAMAVRIKTIGRELGELRRAIGELESNASAAANAAVNAASELHRMGKNEYVTVLVARREVTSLTQRRIDLSEREWELLANWVELTGKLP